MTEDGGIWPSTGGRGWKGGFDTGSDVLSGPCKVLVLNNSFHLKKSMISFMFWEDNSEGCGEKYLNGSSKTIWEVSWEKMIRAWIETETACWSSWKWMERGVGGVLMLSFTCIPMGSVRLTCFLQQPNLSSISLNSIHTVQKHML